MRLTKLTETERRLVAILRLTWTTRYTRVAVETIRQVQSPLDFLNMGLAPPASSYKSFSVMGKTFDPGKPDDYLASFKIRKVT